MLRTAFATVLLLTTAAIDVAAEGKAEDPIEGRIRQTRVVGGHRYATVSVGSDHAVARGMRFSVFGGQTGRELLGTVEITYVDPEECVGRVSGPRAAEVRQDDRARFQKGPRRRGTDEPWYATAAGRRGGE